MIGKFLFTLCLLASVSAVEARPKNVVLMLIDDMGQTDLSCYGSKFFETPHVDALASEGLRFTQASSACTVCSPTRASLLTGKYPSRLHITDWIPGHGRPKAKLLPPADWVQQLPQSETTLAELFHKAGYATVAIGKWHLGGEDNYPEKHGFDQNLGGTDRGQPPSYFSPYKIATLPDGPNGEFLTDRECAEACKFVEAHQEKPFFIYLPHYAVHTPIMAKPEMIAKYQKKAAGQPDYPQKNAKYAGLVASVDESVGKISQKLKELKLWDDTIFVFTSDNGGLLQSVGQNLGLRAGKGSAYEGGTRIPLIVRWPGVTEAGSTSAVPVMTPDLFVTLAANCQLHDAEKRDGRDLMPVLAGGSKLEQDSLYWHYPHYHPGGATPYSSVRKGDYKLIHFFEDNHDELYNLQADPEETTDLAKQDSEKARTASLRAQLEAHWKETKAQMPRDNPQFDPAASKGK